MPHYQNGQLAKIGDHVVGKGYNVPEIITGIVVGVVEGSESCNLRVAFLRPATVRKAHPSNAYDSAKPTGHVIEWAGAIVVDSVPLKVDMEHGDTRGFNLVSSSVSPPARTVDSGYSAE